MEKDLLSKWLDLDYKFLAPFFTLILQYLSMHLTDAFWPMSIQLTYFDANFTGPFVKISLGNVPLCTRLIVSKFFWPQWEKILGEYSTVQLWALVFFSSLIKSRSPYGDRIKFCCRQNVSLSPSLCGFWFQSNWSRQFIYIDFYLCARKRIEFHRNAPLIRREMTVIKVFSWRRHFLHEDFLLANGSKVSKFPIKLKLAWFIRKWRCQINVKIFSQTLFFRTLASRLKWQKDQQLTTTAKSGKDNKCQKRKVLQIHYLILSHFVASGQNKKKKVWEISWWLL